MCEAAQRYDSRVGKFATYAAWWVRARMTTYMRDSKTIVRIVTRKEDRKTFFGLNRARRELGGDPSREVIAAHLGVSIDSVERITTYRSPGGIVRLDERVDGRRQMDPADERAPSEDDLIDQYDDTTQRRRLSAALHILDSRERKIIKACTLRDPPDTLANMGASMGVTRERARQIQERAIEKMRAFLNGDATDRKKRSVYTCSRCGGTPRVPSSTMCCSCKRTYDAGKNRAAENHRLKLEQRRIEGKCLRCGFRPSFVGKELCASCE